MNDVSLPADATNVLVLGPDGEDALELCRTTPSAPAHYLVVSFRRPAVDYAEQLRNNGDMPGAELVVIEARDDTPSNSPNNVIVRRESPTDLTAIGVQSNEFLTRWHDDGEPIVVCFDSITSLLQYAELDLAYRFLHVFTGRIHHAGARGFYHMSPDAHEETTIATIRQLFDAIVERDPGTEEYTVSEW